MLKTLLTVILISFRTVVGGAVEGGPIGGIIVKGGKNPGGQS